MILKLLFRRLRSKAERAMTPRMRGRPVVLKGELAPYIKLSLLRGFPIHADLLVDNL